MNNNLQTSSYRRLILKASILKAILKASMLISFVKLTGTVFKFAVASDLASQSDSYKFDRSRKHYWLLTGRASRI